MSRRTAVVAALAVTSLALGALATHADAGGRAHASRAAKRRPAAARPQLDPQQLWTAYQNGGRGDRLTGGQLTGSVRLPDGRSVFSFATSYLGPVNGRTRPASTPTVDNLYVVTDRSGVPTQTITGPGHTSLFAPPASDGPSVTAAGGTVNGRLVYEPGAMLVDGSTLYQVLWLEAADVHQPVLRVDVAEISLPSLTLRQIDTNVFPGTPTVPSTHPDPSHAPSGVTETYPPIWGSAMAQDASYDYVFGYEQDQGGLSGSWIHVLRTPRGGLATAQPEYLTELGTWLPVPTLSKRLFGGAATGSPHFSAVLTSAGWRLTSQAYLGANLYLFTAGDLAGAWRQSSLYRVAVDPASEFDGIPGDLFPIEVPTYETRPNQVVFSYFNDGGAAARTSDVSKFRTVFSTATLH